MVAFLSSFIQNIIIAVVIATIIEMILPEGSSKKYIKVVIGIYIVFTIISPVITLFAKDDFKLSSIVDLEEYIRLLDGDENSNLDINSFNDFSVKSIYIDNIKTDIQSKLEAKGYTAKEVLVDVEDDENYTLKTITLAIDNLEEKGEDPDMQIENINMINEVEINIQSGNEVLNNTLTESSNLESSQINEIKSYISSCYEISEEKVIVK